ncbi:sigma-70 family RNA polymerase sigma factor [Candidatus Sumerlaeota bacterium]|nr:sigma-70 family RNA polymerase sigma factor [Candidatus Sumerlaeota bacterium]
MKFSPQELQKFYDGNPTTFDDIVKRYASEIIRFISFFTHNYDLAEELAQEVFLRVYQRRRDFRRNDNFKGWLYTIARNVLMQELRKKRYTSEVPLSETDAARLHEQTDSSQSQPDKDYQLREARQILLSGLNQLKYEDAELIILRYFVGLSLKEVSRAMGMPLGTVGVKIQRSLISLRQFFEKQGYSAEDFL